MFERLYRPICNTLFRRTDSAMRRSALNASMAGFSSCYKASTLVSSLRTMSVGSPCSQFQSSNQIGLVKSSQMLTSFNLSRNISLETLHRHTLFPKKKKKKKSPLGGAPQMKGVVLKTIIKKPKKPNSANRRCCLLRLSNGKEMVAYIPGEGHNLQEHNIVMVQVGRLQDVPGVKIVCIRGKFDLSHVVKKTQAV